MPKITAGEMGGRALRYPSSERFRPTMGKVKEALFSIIGESIIDARVLDLYAAAGAVGLEALSRGARMAVFVEKDPLALRHLEENIKTLGLDGRATVVRQDVRIYLRQSKFFATHVYCDPPYRSNLVSQTLDLLAANPGVTDETLIAFEHATGQEIVMPEALELVDKRDYGDSSLCFIRKRQRSGK